MQLRFQSAQDGRVKKCRIRKNEPQEVWVAFLSQKKDCLFCGTNIDLKDNHKKGDHAREIFKVSSSKFVESAISVCDSRLDKWSHKVKGVLNIVDVI